MATRVAYYLCVPLDCHEKCMKYFPLGIKQRQSHFKTFVAVKTKAQLNLMFHLTQILWFPLLHDYQ